MKKFLNSFLDICIRWLPLIFAFSGLISFIMRDPSSSDIIESASLSFHSDPVVSFAACLGALSWAFLSFFWYYLSDLISIIVGLFRKSSGKKSVDQKEV